MNLVLLDGGDSPGGALDFARRLRIERVAEQIALLLTSLPMADRNAATARVPALIYELEPDHPKPPEETKP